MRRLPRRVVEIDEELAARAARLLGTASLKATIHRALEEVVARDTRMKLVERLRTMNGLDLDNQTVMRGAWR